MGGLLLGGGGSVLVFQDPQGGLLRPAAIDFLGEFCLLERLSADP